MAILKDLLVTGAANVSEGVTSPTFTGDLIGNSNTTSKLKTAVNIQVGNSDGSNPGTAVSFDGSSGVVLKLPSQITASLNGVAAKASKINTSSAIGSANIPVYVAADGTVTSTGKSFANYLPLSGGTMTGEIAVGQGDGKGIQLGADGRINAGGSTYTVCGISGSQFLSGHTQYALILRGSGSRPTFNGSDLALYSDIPTNYVTTNTAQTISGAKTFSAATKITNTTSATSTSTGALIVSGGVGVAGNLYAAKVYNAVWNDYAELFPRGEETEAGDIIALDLSSEKEKYIKAIKGNKALIGVESNEYGHLIGGDANTNLNDNLENYIPVGLAGRVWVKVHDEPELGDYITASDIPGVGEATNDRSQAIGIVVAKKRDGKVRIKII